MHKIIMAAFLFCVIAPSINAADAPKQAMGCNTDAAVMTAGPGDDAMPRVAKDQTRHAVRAPKPTDCVDPDCPFNQDPGGGTGGGGITGWQPCICNNLCQGPACVSNSNSQCQNSLTGPAQCRWCDPC